MFKLIELFMYAMWLLAVIGLALLGRWVYRHPDRFLDKFNPYAKPHGRLALGWTKITGVLWVLVSTGAIFGCFMIPVARFIPDWITLPSIVLFAAAVTWFLLRQTKAKPERF